MSGGRFRRAWLAPLLAPLLASLVCLTPTAVSPSLADAPTAGLHQVVKPRPGVLAREFMRKYPVIVNNRDSFQALTELFNRLQGRDPLKRAAAAAELRTIRQLAGRADVVRIYLPPSRRGSRTPDGVYEVRRPGGGTRLERFEVKTMTGRKRGSPGRAGNGQRIPSNANNVHSFKQAVKNGIRSKGKHASQLSVPLTVSGRVVPPTGTLFVHLPRIDASNEAIAEQGMSELASELANATYLESVEVLAHDGTIIGRWVRASDGSYPRDLRTRDEVETSSLRGLLSPALWNTLTDAEKLGGIDFSSMELRYLSVGSSDDASEVSYAFRAAPAAGGGSAVDGVRSAVQASDAFFVWLALPPSRFWVNLNPDEPNRIMDAAFGRTDAGRVLLQSDFLLKRTDSKLMNPHTPLGDRYWEQLRPAPDGTYCLTYRIWIVPGTAKVRETEDSVYIVDAPLDVRMRPNDIRAAGCAAQPEATKRHNAAVYRRLLLPKVKQKVNHAPEFQPLRRVYLSRVAAEWYRQNSADVPSAYGDLIDSGNVDRWHLKGSWRPRQTYQEYVRAFRGGGFDYKERIVRGNVVETHTYRTGGVDFTALLKQNLGADAFESLAPGLTETVAKGLERTTVDPHTNARWLGGQTPVEPVADEEGAAPDDTAPDDDTAASVPPDDPWSRDYAPYVVPLMVLAGVGLVGLAVLRERRRQPMRGPR